MYSGVAVVGSGAWRPAAVRATRRVVRRASCVVGLVVVVVVYMGRRRRRWVMMTTPRGEACCLQPPTSNRGSAVNTLPGPGRVRVAHTKGLSVRAYSLVVAVVVVQ